MSDEVPEKFNKCLLYLLIILFIITGSLNTIFLKCIQNIKSLEVKFEEHHWIYNHTMFLGELIALFFYIYIKKAKKEELKDDKNIENEGGTLQDSITEKTAKKPPVPSNLIFAISAGCDLLGSILSLFGLIYLSSSLYQMMTGFLLVLICLWSKILLKYNIYRHHILGIGSLILGLILVGLSVKFISKNNDKIKHPIIGTLLVIFAQFFSSFGYIVQEKIIKTYDVHPLQLVGYEGLWGIIVFTFLLIIFQFIPCNNWGIEGDICTINDNDKYHLEDSIFSFRQIWEKKSILILFIFYIISIFLYNVVGINITKLVSSTSRAVADNARIVFVYLFFFIFGPEGTKETFDLIQFIGFLFLIIGTLIYNEIIVLPFWGLDYYIRKNIIKRQKQELLDKLKKESITDDYIIRRTGRSIEDNNETNENESEQ